MRSLQVCEHVESVAAVGAFDDDRDRARTGEARGFLGEIVEQRVGQPSAAVGGVERQLGGDEGGKVPACRLDGYAGGQRADVEHVDRRRCHDGEARLEFVHRAQVVRAAVAEAPCPVESVAADDAADAPGARRVAHPHDIAVGGAVQRHPVVGSAGEAVRAEIEGDRHPPVARRAGKAGVHPELQRRRGRGIAGRCGRRFSKAGRAAGRREGAR